jgi:hypothetical protein
MVRAFFGAGSSGGVSSDVAAHASEHHCCTMTGITALKTMLFISEGDFGHQLRSLYPLGCLSPRTSAAPHARRREHCLQFGSGASTRWAPASCLLCPRVFWRKRSSSAGGRPAACSSAGWRLHGYVCSCCSVASQRSCLACRFRRPSVHIRYSTRLAVQGCVWYLPRLSCGCLAACGA